MHRVTKRHLLAIAALLSAGLVASTWAHSPLDHPDWCTENGRLVVVDEVDWDGETLARMVQRETGRSSCTASKSGGIGTRTCGQFDDDWGAVNAIAINHCGSFAVGFVGATHPDHGTVVHITTGPEAFNDEQRHHERYRATMGLRTMCVRCEPAKREPLRPAEPVMPVR